MCLIWIKWSITRIQLSKRTKLACVANRRPVLSLRYRGKYHAHHITHPHELSNLHFLFSHSEFSMRYSDLLTRIFRACIIAMILCMCACWFALQISPISWVLWNGAQQHCSLPPQRQRGCMSVGVFPELVSCYTEASHRYSDLSLVPHRSPWFRIMTLIWPGTSMCITQWVSPSSWDSVWSFHWV